MESGFPQVFRPGLVGNFGRTELEAVLEYCAEFVGRAETLVALLFEYCLPKLRKAWGGTGGMCLVVKPPFCLEKRLCFGLQKYVEIALV